MFDYDSEMQKTFLITVTVHDAAYHSASQDININLLNINDNPPIFVRPVPAMNNLKEVPETTEKGAELYTLSASDADGDSISYSLTQQTPANPVGFELIGTAVYLTNTFDFETDITDFELTFQ